MDTLYLNKWKKQKMFDLSWRVAVITGASSGLWKQMAHGFAQQWADLVILARRYEKLLELKEEIEKDYSVKVYPIKCDITSTEDINNAAALAEKEFWKVDILLNCAWDVRNAWLLDMKDEDWDYTIKVDLTWTFKVTRAFAEVMKKNNYWRIINIASMYGLVWCVNLPTIGYYASKWWVVNFTRATAAELAQYNITCNAICPWYFETELTIQNLEKPEFKTFMNEHVPMKRYWKSWELNAGAAFLASDEASYITWAILPIDWGYTAV